MMKRSWLLIPALAILSTVGCAARVYATGYATVPPPPVRAEYYGVAPGPGYVWVGGYYRWGGASYAWSPGYWARPPRPHAVWAPGVWAHRGGRYYWREGHWR